MNNTALTIIMPAFNAEKTIGTSIESVLSNKSENFELIVINDGSTDSTEEIIKSFNDDRLRYISKENSGVSSTRNFGLKNATGEYVTFIDSDDLYVDGAVDKILDYIVKYSFDMLGFGFYMEYVRDGKVYKTDANTISDTVVFNIENAPDYFSYIFESSHILFQASWNKIFRRSIFSEYNIEFNDKLVCYENLTMIFDFLYHANSIVFLNDILYRYKIYSDRPVSIIEKRNKLELTDDVSACYRNFVKLCEKYNYPKKYRDYMNGAFYEDYVFCSRKYFAKSKKYSTKQLYNAFQKYLSDENFLVLREQYLNDMTFYRILFALFDHGFKHSAYKLYKRKIIK